MNDPNVASKLDLSKPVNFYIHSWLGLVLGEGIPFKNDGKLTFYYFFTNLRQALIVAVRFCSKKKCVTTSDETWKRLNYILLCLTTKTLVIKYFQKLQSILAIKWARHAESNACAVNWSRLAHYKYAISATKHTKMVAAATVNFMNFLTQHGINVQQTSIAGFGVGAHIAGFIGASFPKQKLAAIYGMIFERK